MASISSYAVLESVRSLLVSGTGNSLITLLNTGVPSSMPLPESVKRELLHRRHVYCDAYRRDDGLWDIDARMTDIKTYDIAENEEGNSWEADQPYHDMYLRITLDKQFLIHKVQAAMDSMPFGMCTQINKAFKKLEGTRIGPGWHNKTRELLGGIKGCTHLHDLLKPVATTAVQAIFPLSDEKVRKASAVLALNSCHTWSQSSDMVKLHFSELYVSEKSKHFEKDLMG